MVFILLIVYCFVPNEYIVYKTNVQTHNHAVLCACPYPFVESKLEPKFVEYFGILKFCSVVYRHSFLFPAASLDSLDLCIIGLLCSDFGFHFLHHVGPAFGGPTSGSVRGFVSLSQSFKLVNAQLNAFSGEHCVSTMTIK